MIRAIGVLTGAVLAMSACSGAPEPSFEANCAILVADPDAQSSLRGMGADAVSFCACMSELTAAKSSEDQAQISSALATLTAKMQDTGQGVETVAPPLMDEAMARPDDADAQALVAGVEKLGRLVDEIEGAFGDGVCAPS